MPTIAVGNRSVIESTRSHRVAIEKSIIRLTATVEKRVEIPIMNHVAGVTAILVTLLISILIDLPLMIIVVADRIFTASTIAMVLHRRINVMPVALRLIWAITVIRHHQEGPVALLLTS